MSNAHFRLLLLFALSSPPAIVAQTAASTRAVLVTGASSGIGRKITERLASRGFFVYAGARAQQDLDALNAIANVQAIRLDVTVASDVAAAVATVTKAGRGLYGVVNNAGVVVVSPLIELEEKDLDFIFGVNVYGPYRITKAFAPLLLEAKGRVVNISSLNGIVASPMIGAYSMSKHAIEAYGDGLAAELARFGVRVSLIEPGNYGTEIGRNMIARMDTSIVKGSRSRRRCARRSTRCDRSRTIRLPTMWLTLSSTRCRVRLRRCATSWFRRRTRRQSPSGS